MANRGFIVSSATGATALTGSAWSSMLTLSENAVNTLAKQPSSSAIWGDLELQFTIATNGGTVRAQLWYDSAGLIPFYGPTATTVGEVQNLSTVIPLGNTRKRYPSLPEAGGLRKLYLKLYPSADMTLAIGGAKAQWDESRSE